MSSRNDQLAQHRRDLQAQCELQRQQMECLGANIDARLQSTDRVIDVVASVARNPAALLGVISATLILGPWRILRWVSRGALFFRVARAVRHLVAK